MSSATPDMRVVVPGPGRTWLDRPRPGSMICMDTVHERVEIEAMGAYAARPAEPGDHPGPIVGSQMFGVTGYTLRTTDLIAALGYTASAPDVSHRTAPGLEGQPT